MRTRSLWRSNSRRLTLLLLTIAVPPAATLVWLGVQLLAQERSLLAQRDLELRQVAIQNAIRSLEQSLADVERRTLDGPLPDGVIRFRLSTTRIDAEPAGRVLWLPVARELPPVEDVRFAEAERLEFQGRTERAVPIYRDASRSSDLRVRAGALLRLGRTLRRQQRWNDALVSYRSLAAIDSVAIAGAPADLQARRAMCALLAESGRAAELAREASSLEVDLLAGRWTLDRPSWELTAAEIERWSGRPVPALADRRLFSAAADLLWTERSADTPARRLASVEHTPVTLVARSSGANGVVLAIAPAVVRAWIENAAAGTQRSGARLTATAASGEVVAGPSTPSGSNTLKWSASDTGLPWSIALVAGDASAARAEFATRRRLLATGLVAILLLLAGGSYFLWRVMQRELAVARLQTEFVSAVSHEFRTPLTSIRHVSELLAENDDMPRERRRTFYEALDRNTDRLHRLVESLLDFARMEGGRKPYDFQPIHAGALAADVVADFQKDVAPRGFTIDLDVDAAADMRVRADAASLTHALWNLLDNAVKYSTEPSVVRVGLERRNGHVQISVRDHGIGIPAHERPVVFDKFQRGAQARTLGIKGTGIGLTMVHEIVRAHHGRVEVESEPGRGSTFTIVLPYAIS
jgi:signal transduction histidine kinase